MPRGSVEATARNFAGANVLPPHGVLRGLWLFNVLPLQVVRGLWLLNAGTVSIAVFLHTMRFKKLLPPRVAFSLYVAMAYASFVGGRI